MRLRRRRGVLAGLLLHDAGRQVGLGQAGRRDSAGVRTCGSPQRAGVRFVWWLLFGEVREFVLLCVARVRLLQREA
ncbi:MAG TPA: hypothetical protein PKC18_09540 [Lacipirellulaceae bacterium]|nr:hypothetical protein [Lacipirellulaceae bacterium]